MIIDHLLEIGADLFHPQEPMELETEKFFAIQEALLWQYEKNPLFHQFCKLKNYFPLRDLKSPDQISDIPYLTTASYKKFTNRAKDMLLVPESEIKVWSLSRGTLGDPSMVGRDEINLDRLMLNIQILFDEIVQLKAYSWILFFFPEFKPQPSEFDNSIKMLHFNYILNRLFVKSSKETVFAIKVVDPKARSDAKRFGLDVDATVKSLMTHLKDQEPGIIFGLGPSMYDSLMGIAKKTGQKSVALNPDTKVLTFGGWALPNGLTLSSEKFRHDLSALLGIPEENFRDLYSFTECDVGFMECEYHYKHVPPWVDLIVRDVENLVPVPAGEKGIFNILNPLAHSYAGVSLLQDDVIRILPEEEGECPCGRKGKRIEVFGFAH